MKSETDRLNLMALDEEDLQILSAHLQDAVLRVADMTWLAADKRFALVANRFNWERAESGAAAHGFERRRTGLHFDRVFAVTSRGIDRKKGDQVLELLAIRFIGKNAPAGEIELDFAGGATIRLQVECIEAALSDLGAAWATEALPQHDVDEGR